jgi:hypothetical protein
MATVWNFEDVSDKFNVLWICTCVKLRKEINNLYYYYTVATSFAEKLKLKLYVTMMENPIQ